MDALGLAIIFLTNNQLDDGCFGGVLTEIGRAGVDFGSLSQSLREWQNKAFSDKTMEKLQVKILIGLAKAFPGAHSYSLFVFACVLCANQNFMTIDCKIV